MGAEGGLNDLRYLLTTMKFSSNYFVCLQRAITFVIEEALIHSDTTRR